MTEMNHLKRQENENLLEWKIRLCSRKDEYGLTWDQIKNIINNETGDNFGESAYRKWFTNFKQGVEYAKSKNLNEHTLNELRIKELEIEKERKKLQAEKAEINKWLREQCRTENFYEKLMLAIENKKNVKVPNYKIEYKQNEIDPVVAIADIHYGKEIKIFGLEDEILNEYNVEIFEKRMWDLLNKIVTKLERDNLKRLNLFNLSDSIDGILRMSQLQSLQLGITDSIIGFAEFMTVWLNELSKYTYIDYYSCQGNHNEVRPLGSKSGEFPHENTERIITWYLKGMLRDNPNIKIHDNKNLVYVDVLGTKILATHGQDERNLEQSVKDYMLVYNKPIHILLTGHLHNSHNKTVAKQGLRNIEFVQCPSICGIDDYSLKLKKTANAGATMFLIEKGLGKTTTYDFKLV